MENKTEYRKRLLLEYRDIVVKREKLCIYLNRENDKTGTEKDLKNRELMNRQEEILAEYEEILFCRLMLELTTD
jgi:hypothetical protein